MRRSDAAAAVLLCLPMSEQLPKISIVTPNFNQAPFLEETIQSVLGQGYPNLEYVIIDGGSTDGSVDIIRKYESQLHYWCSEPDQGHYNALNKGFAQTSGQIMAWINSDDFYFPWTLKTVASLFGDLTNVRWLTPIVTPCFDYHGQSLYVHRLEGVCREAFLDGCYAAGSGRRGSIGPGRFFGYFQQESTFWRRDLWEEVGGHLREEFSLAADFDLWARMATRAQPAGFRGLLGGFRIRESQRSGDQGSYSEQATESLNEQRELAGLPSVQHSGAQRVPVTKWQVPKFRDPSYRGAFIFRQNEGKPEATWGLQHFGYR